MRGRPMYDDDSTVSMDLCAEHINKICVNLLTCK